MIRFQSRRHEEFVNTCDAFIHRQVHEYAELRRTEQFDGWLLDETYVIPQPAIHPAERMDAQFLSILMRAFCDVQTKLMLFFVQIVNVPHLAMNVNDSIQRKNGILVRVADQQRTGCHKRGDSGEVPAICVHEIHAVAVSLDTAIDDMIPQTADSRHRYGTANAFIQRRQPPAVSSASRASRDTETTGVHFRACFEIIEGADAVPCFNAGRRVAAHVPPPAIVGIRAMMDALDLAHLNRVNGQAGVAVASEPDTMMVVRCFVAKTDVSFFGSPVAADVQHRRQGASIFSGR